jgi:MoxR-like ATPase
MTRNVRKVGAHRSKKESEEALPFSKFTETTNLILLGEPGSGKSHLFRETATAGSGTCVPIATSEDSFKPSSVHRWP